MFKNVVVTEMIFSINNFFFDIQNHSMTFLLQIKNVWKNNFDIFNLFQSNIEQSIEVFFLKFYMVWNI